MSLRIRTNIMAQEASKNSRELSRMEQEEFVKLSSGKRTYSFKEDPAGGAVAQNLKAQVRGIKQAVRNTNDGISMLQTAEGGLTEISNILVRLRELTIQSASDTVSDDERVLLDLEYQQLLQEVDRISETTTFHGRSLLAGSGNGILDFQVGTEANEFNIIQFDADSPNSSASGIGIDGTSIDEKDSALDNFEAIDGALATISGHRAGLGALQNRLHSTSNNLETQSINIDEARSRIEDVDIADSVASIASLGVQKQASIAALAQSNNIPLSALKLIG